MLLKDFFVAFFASPNNFPHQVKLIIKGDIIVLKNCLFFHAKIKYNDLSSFWTIYLLPLSLTSNLFLCNYFYYFENTTGNYFELNGSFGIFQRWKAFFSPINKAQIS